MKTALIAALLLVQGGDDAMRVSVGCRGSEPLVIRIEMDHPGVVEIPVQAIAMVCDRGRAL